MSSETPPDAAALAAAGTPAAADGGASNAEGAMSAGGTSPPDKPPSSPGAGLGTQETTASAGTHLGLLQDAAGLRSLLLQRCSQQQLARSLASQPPTLPHAESGAPMGKPPAMAGASESRPPATAETDKYILLLEENRRLQAQILTSERGESQHLTGPFRQGWGKPRPDTPWGTEIAEGVQRQIGREQTLTHTPHAHTDASHLRRQVNVLEMDIQAVRHDLQVTKTQAATDKSNYQDRLDRNIDRSDKEDRGFVAARNANDMANKLHAFCQNGGLKKIVGEALRELMPTLTNSSISGNKHARSSEQAYPPNKHGGAGPSQVIKQKWTLAKGQNGLLPDNHMSGFGGVTHFTKALWVADPAKHENRTEPPDLWSELQKEALLMDPNAEGIDWQGEQWADAKKLLTRMRADCNAAHKSWQWNCPRTVKEICDLLDREGKEDQWCVGVSPEGEDHLWDEPYFCDIEDQRWQGVPIREPTRDYPPYADHVRSPTRYEDIDRKPDPRAMETRRRRYNDIRTEMRMLPVKLSLSSPPQTYRVWLANIERILRNQLGPSWMDEPGFDSGEMAECAIGALESAFQHRAQLKNTLSEAGWCFETFIAWIEALRPVQVHSEETDTRRQLLSGMFQQGNLSVSDYWSTISREFEKIPDMTDSEQRALFLQFLSNDLFMKCQFNDRGVEFDSIRTLVAHALRAENLIAVAKRRSYSLLSKTSKPAQYNRYKRGGMANMAHGFSSLQAMDCEMAEAGAMDQPPADQGRDDGPQQQGPQQRYHPGTPPYRGGPRDGGRQYGRGGIGGGRGRGVAAAATSGFDMRGPPNQPFSRNRHISNGQAGWLHSQNRCFQCYRPMPECIPGRENYKFCDRKATASPVPARLQGLPPWEK